MRMVTDGGDFGVELLRGLQNGCALRHRNSLTVKGQRHIAHEIVRLVTDARHFSKKARGRLSVKKVKRPSLMFRVASGQNSNIHKSFNAPSAPLPPKRNTRWLRASNTAS